MAPPGPQTIHLPDGHNITVTPVFAGLFFKSQDPAGHAHAFPTGWTVVLHTEDPDEEETGERTAIDQASEKAEENLDDERDDKLNKLGSRLKGVTPTESKQPKIHSFTKPTLHNDKLFISSISSPCSDCRPAGSPTRQIAMMLWVTLYWYFHQRPPEAVLHTDRSKHTPDAGKPRGEWSINIMRDGVLRGRNLIPKLERMGLIRTMDSAVGTSVDDPNESWSRMFVTQKMFWQIPGRLFLFTQSHDKKGHHSYPGSPTTSRPTSPAPPSSVVEPPTARPAVTASGQLAADLPGAPHPPTLTTAPAAPTGPFYSSSHLPTYYPPAPTVYTMTDYIRHPVRPKPPRMGEIFYTRFVPSVGQYLSFRVASISPKPVPYLGPAGPHPPEQRSQLSTLSDTSLLKKWLSNPRVSAFWGEYMENFLPAILGSRHSFPVIGMWDGVPFGYFEIYWVKEDVLGKYSGAADDYDRGFHVLIGEDWARGRVQPWLSGLVHYCLCADYRTNSVCIEPRVDNERSVAPTIPESSSRMLTDSRFIQHLQVAGFSKEREVTFPHKQSWFGRLRRENWNGPAL